MPEPAVPAVHGPRPRSRSAGSTAAVVLLAASAAYGHIGYPVLLHALTAARRPRRYQRAARPQQDFAPAITVLVPAFLEQGVIAEKIANIRAVGYHGPMRILVVADGDEASAQTAEAAGVDVIRLPHRLGKAQALNRGIAAVTDEIVVFTDANSVLQPGALDELVAPFQEPLVGAVAGEKQEGEHGEGAYWRFANSLKSLESGLGSTLGLDGGLAAVRRSTWRPIPEGISNDDYWIALDLMERGLQVRYAPTALMTEDSIGSVARSWERRTRVLGGSLYVAWRKRHLLKPSAGLVSFELWGHKVWRSTAGPLSHVALLAIAVVTARRSRAARAFLLVHAYGLAAVARPSLPASALGQLLFLQAVALGGMLRLARGDRMLQWKKPAR